MTTSLDTIRYHSGIAGEEVADMVDSLEREVSSLREQVEKLTEECVVLRASNRTKLDTIAYLETREDENKQKLAAFAEQNEKLKEALDAVSISSLTHARVKTFVDKALSLPNLSSPVLNRIRAEGMRMAADICSEKHSLSGAEEAIRARAAELEKTNG